MKSDNSPILETDNYITVFGACSDALTEQKMIAVIGDTGLGKSTAIKSFRKQFSENTHIVTAKKSMTPRHFFSKVLNTIGDEKYDPGTSLHFYIERAARTFNDEPANQLLIIDEAGKFSAPMLEYMHEFRDLTSQSTGILLIGVDYFRRNLKRWKDQERDGMPEVYSRINYWQELKKPTKREIRAICNAYGIKNETFIKSQYRVDNYRDLVENNIPSYLKLQQEFDNENRKPKPKTRRKPRRRKDSDDTDRKCA